MLNYIGRKRDRIRTANDAAKALLKAFNFAHLAIMDQIDSGMSTISLPCQVMFIHDLLADLVGNTTLLAGMMLELTTDLRGNTPYAFVAASVGDCKAFHLDPVSGSVRNLQDPSLVSLH